MLTQPPTLQAFMDGPIEEIRPIAPQTLILTNGGTRRQAVLAGISPHSDEYASWSRCQMTGCLDMIFQHGVQHIFTTVLTESNYAETTPGYREKLASWIEWGLAGPEALADYRDRGWRVRLIGAETWLELAPTAKRLAQETATHKGPTVWFMAASYPEARWDHLFQVLQGQKISTREEAIRAIYGQDIPLATLYIGDAKPQIFASIVPPLLVGKLECYWGMYLGYDLNETKFRSILYDYAYIRNTWTADKSDRAEKILEFQDAWKNAPVIGLGTRLGPFWYSANGLVADQDKLAPSQSEVESC